MFGSKNKKSTKKQVGISVKTMSSDLKGGGSKKMAIEYENLHSNQDNKTTTKNTKPTEQQEIKGDTSFQAPFGQNKTVEEEVQSNAHSQGIGKANIPQGTFTTPAETKEVKSINNPTAANANNDFSLTENKFTNTNSGDLQTGKSAETPFLHTATDNQNDNKIIQQKTGDTSDKIEKKSSASSIIWIISFILLLATILLGGYYFYMKSSDKKTEKQKPTTKSSVKNSGNQVKQKNTTNSTTNNTTTNNKNITKSNKATTPTTKKQTMVIDKFNTTEVTFNNDLKEFVNKLKSSNHNTELKNGIFVTPMTSETTPFNAKALLKTTHLTEIFDVNNLKPACKLFIASDNNLIRVALIFELQDTVDSKLIKDKIIKNEQILPAKMRYLFMDGERPTAPPVIKFSVNSTNYNSRYFNYLPPKVTSSVDWNILDLGKGKIVYFATSKKLAEKITGYFMKMVVK
jgi:uncharacterized protein YneF (UPF0154 family)